MNTLWPSVRQLWSILTLMTFWPQMVSRFTLTMYNTCSAPNLNLLCHFVFELWGSMTQMSKNKLTKWPWPLTFWLCKFFLCGTSMASVLRLSLTKISAVAQKPRDASNSLSLHSLVYKNELISSRMCMCAPYSTSTKQWRTNHLSWAPCSRVLTRSK